MPNFDDFDRMFDKSDAHRKVRDEQALREAEARRVRVEKFESFLEEVTPLFERYRDYFQSKGWAASVELTNQERSTGPGQIKSITLRIDPSGKEPMSTSRNMPNFRLTMTTNAANPEVYFSTMTPERGGRTSAGEGISIENLTIPNIDARLNSFIKELLEHLLPGAR